MPRPSSSRSIEKRVEWSVRASRDLLDIVTYLIPDNPRAAFSIVDYIHRRVGELGKQPRLGRLSRAGGPRKLVLTRYPYNIHYRLRGRRLIVVRVLHQRRRSA